MIWFWQGRGFRGLLEGWHGSWADSREWRTDIEWADSKKWKTGSRVLPPLSPPFKVLPPLSPIFNLKGSPRVILKNSDGSRMGRWHRTKDWLVVGRLCNAVLQIKRAGIQTHPLMTISFLLLEGQNCFLVTIRQLFHMEREFPLYVWIYIYPVY